MRAACTQPAFERRTRRRRATPAAACVLAVAAAALAQILAGCTRKAEPEGRGTEPPAHAVPAPPAPPPSAFSRMVFPSEQTGLLTAPPESVFQPTAAGRIESAFYGSVRTAASGYAQFHEGIDIAPTRRDPRGRALDRIFAAAPGTVGYINRASGNSNYGIYIVLLHEDPVGQVYTLYAHLAQVAAGLHPGQQVREGAELGTMGHTPASLVPAVRSHLHFEVGLINNSRFRAWFLGQKLKPDHGLYNGWNLLALDARRVYERQQALRDGFTLLDHLRTVPRALSLVVASPRKPDFFQRYPVLWEGPDPTAPAIVVECSENGIPLAGRAATPAEIQTLGSRAAAVLSVNEAALGRNGCRLVVKRNGAWEPGNASARWRDILLY